MKTILFSKYGSPDVLELGETERPSPAVGEVLVKVEAASVNSWDWDLLRGETVNRLMFGLSKPKVKTLGADIAGRVQAIGEGVTRFEPGDEVWGDLCACGWGGFADYVCAPQDSLALKPATMTFEQAAAVPQAGLLALQGLRDKGGIESGQKVLINGAGGGVGTFAVQIAKSVGADVTGVDSIDKLDTLLSIGADTVIDYEREDFAAGTLRYDLILDVVMNRSVSRYTRMLNPNGTFVVVGGSLPRILQTVMLGPLIKRMRHKQACVLAHRPNDGLSFMRELIDAGHVVSVIDGVYPLDNVAEAFRYFARNAHTGKIVIVME